MTVDDEITRTFSLPAETVWTAVPGTHMNRSWIGEVGAQPKYVLRLYHADRTPEDVRNEHKTLEALAMNLAVQVPQPMTAIKGGTFVTNDSQQATIFEYIPGIHPNFSRAAAVDSAASMLASCHASLWNARDEISWVAKTRQPLTPAIWPSAAELRQNLELASAALPIRLTTDAFLKTVMGRAKQAMNRLDTIRSTAHLIHADINPSNLLVGGEETAITALLDWDECRWDLPIYDLCGLLSSVAEASLKADAITAYVNALAGTAHPYANDMDQITQLLPDAYTVRSFNELLIMLASGRHHPGYLEKLLTLLSEEVG